MRCLFIYKEEYPWDVRVEKIVDSLVDHGHEVLLVCRNLRQEVVEEQAEGFKIWRLPVTSRLPSFLQKMFNLALWFNPVWVSTVFRAAKDFRPDVIIVRDLPLVMTGIAVGRRWRARVIFDMAECYPEMYRSSRQFRKRRSKGSWAKSPWLAGLYERWAVQRVDHVLVMIEESRERLIGKGLDPRAITIVSNTPPMSKVPPHPREHHGTALRIIYVGFLTRIRGLDVLIRGVRAYLDSGGEGGPIQVDVIGKGAARDELVTLVEQLGLQGHVRIHGWLEHSEVADLMEKANVGALTYRICGHWNHTIPNKLFDYMAMGLPVLATGVHPIARILGGTESGVVCRDQDPGDLAAKLLELRDAQFRQYLGHNGHAAIVSGYHWEVDERRLLDVIRNGS